MRPLRRRRKPNPERWPKLVYQLVYLAIKKNGPGEWVPLPRIVDDPSANILLVRGVSWRDDATFKRLEWELVNRFSANAIRYSYKGFRDTDDPINYTPNDIIRVGMHFHVDTLDKYVRALLETDVPLSIVAFSLGGLVTSNWVCRPDPPGDHLDLLRQVHTIALIGSPLFPPYNTIRGPDPLDETQIISWAHSPEGFDRKLFLNLFPNVLVNIYGTEDSIAPREYATLKGLSSKRKAIKNKEIWGATHLELPGLDKTVKFVLKHLKFMKRS